MSDLLHAPSGETTPSLSLVDLQRAVIDNLPTLMLIYEVVSRTSFRLIMINRAFSEYYHMAEADVVGKYLHELLPPKDATVLIQRLQVCLDTGDAIIIEDSYTVDPTGTIWTISRFAPLRSLNGPITHLLVTSEDITERKAHEREAEQAHLAIIEQQSAQLTELSTPLLTVSDTVVVMPLIGSIDDRRVQQMMESLLEGVSLRRATIVILDITGVPIVDTHVANALIRASQAVRLLGAKVVLTGIRPEVAQTLVGLGVDLSSIITRGTLRDGIAYALH